MTTRWETTAPPGWGESVGGKGRFVQWVSMGILVGLLVGAVSVVGVSEGFSRLELIEDARQLLAILEDNHPDPYLHEGGKVAFRLRFLEMLASIPEEGMTAEGSSRLLVPFVASVGDGHTDVWAQYALDPYLPGGVPLRIESEGE